MNSPKEHDSRENQRGSEDIAPIAFHIQEDGCDDITEDFAEGDVELVQGHQVAADSSLDSFSDVYRDFVMESASELQHNGTANWFPGALKRSWTLTCTSL